MQRPTTNSTANPSSLIHRAPAGDRSRTGYNIDGNISMPMPQGSTAQPYGALPRNGNMMPGSQSFEIARSPPNPAKQSTLSSERPYQGVADNFDRYEACSVQIFQTRHLPGRICVPIPSHHRYCRRYCALQIFCEGSRWLPHNASCVVTDTGLYRVIANSEQNALWPISYQTDEE
jgi:hypothetical protein